jgi:hypothetical protein
MNIPRILLSLIPLFALLCSPPTRAADVIQTQPFTNGSVEVDVIKAAVREGILTIQIVSRNTGDENLKIGYGLENFYFLDQKAKKKYHVLRDSSGAWFVSPACDPAFAPQTDTVTVPPGGRTLMWFKFPAPSIDTTKIDLFIPNVMPFEDLPITR